MVISRGWREISQCFALNRTLSFSYQVRLPPPGQGPFEKHSGARARSAGREGTAAQAHTLEGYREGMCAAQYALSAKTAGHTLPTMQSFSDHRQSAAVDLSTTLVL